MVGVKFNLISRDSSHSHEYYRNYRRSFAGGLECGISNKEAWQISGEERWIANNIPDLDKYVDVKDSIE